MKEEKFPCFWQSYETLYVHLLKIGKSKLTV